MGTPLTGVDKAAVHGTQELSFRLDWLRGDSRELELREVSLIGGNTNFRPLGRGIDVLMSVGDRRGF